MVLRRGGVVKVAHPLAPKKTLLGSSAEKRAAAEAGSQVCRGSDGPLRPWEPWGNGGDGEREGLKQIAHLLRLALPSLSFRLQS
ncbi:hypothetical protein BKA56DRAFT_570055 [Ilyonectria sp. MPI-CAGE-AT-0026]|nr:hypothetical protein BKA56DRAFT_570055 [Ilyonectria sp. MPI-CAGE-AT-0026]